MRERKIYESEREIDSEIYERERERKTAHKKNKL